MISLLFSPHSVQATRDQELDPGRPMKQSNRGSLDNLATHTISVVYMFKHIKKTHKTLNMRIKSCDRYFSGIK